MSDISNGYILIWHENNDDETVTIVREEFKHMITGNTNKWYRKGDRGKNTEKFKTFLAVSWHSITSGASPP